MNKGENSLGLDNLDEEDFVIDDTGQLDLGLPAFDEASKPEEKKENIKPSEEEKTTPETVAEEQGKDKTLEGTVNSSSPGLSKIYSSLATHLSKEGVLSNLDIEKTNIEDADALSQAINSEIESRVGSVQSAYKKAMEAGVPQDEYVQYERMKTQLDGITDDAIESEVESAIDLRKNIIGQDFLNRGFSKEEALKYAQRSIDLGEDVNDAKASIVRLREHNQKQYDNAIKSKQDEEAAVHTNIKKFIETTDEVIKGVKISQNIKDKLFDQIVTPVGNNENGKPINAYHNAYEKDPVKFQVIQNYLYMVTNGYTDFSKVNNAAASQVSKGLDDLLKSNSQSLIPGGQVDFNIQDSESTFSLGGEDFKLDV